jgi:hypothetical protein
MRGRIRPSRTAVQARVRSSPPAAITDTQPVKDARDVVAHGVRGKGEGLGDFLVGKALGNQTYKVENVTEGMVVSIPSVV